MLSLRKIIILRRAVTLLLLLILIPVVVRSLPLPPGTAEKPIPEAAGLTADVTFCGGLIAPVEFPLLGPPAIRIGEETAASADAEPEAAVTDAVNRGGVF